METASIFFPSSTPHSIDTVTVDCVITDTFNYESLVPDYPVEDGFYIQDNIYNKPFVYQMKGIISDSALSSLTNLIEGSANTASQDALEKLLDLRDKKTTFDIVTSLKVYSNMVFTKLEPIRDKDTGNSLTFTAEFKQITKVTSKTTVINANNTDDKSYPDTVNKGNQTIDENKEAPEEASDLYNMWVK